MRKFILICTLVVADLNIYAQKPVIDISDFEKWPFVYGEKLSDDGNYVTYGVKEEGRETQVFQSSNLGWKKSIVHSSGGDILSNSKYGVFRTLDDSLYLLKLGTDSERYIGNAAFYTLFKGKNNQEWLAYQEPGEHARFVIQETLTGEEKSEINVKGHLFNENAGILLLLICEVPEKKGCQALCRWNVHTGKKEIIWEGGNVSNYVFDDSGDRIAFLADDDDNKCALWYYKTGMKRAKRVEVDPDSDINSNMIISSEANGNNSPLVFSSDGNSLFFYIQEMPEETCSQDFPRVDIWSYKDLHLQEEQLRRSFNLPYLAVLHTEGMRMQRLQKDNESLYRQTDLRNCNHFLIVTENGNCSDLWWLPEARSSVYLESVQDGNRTLLKGDIPYAQDWFKGLNFVVSPDDKYVIYYDPFKNNYFSYEIERKITHNLTEGIDVKWVKKDNQYASPLFVNPEGIAGWTKNDEAILIYDEFDIWKIDPSGVLKPLNFTHAYGYIHHTQLRLTGSSYERRTPLSVNTKVLLRAFNTENKYSGFYYLSLSKNESPIELTMGPYTYGDPIKSRNVDVWMVFRQSDKESPNVFLTSNWKDFIGISLIQPQLRFNWLTAELVKWPLPDSSLAEGILYKPENFDSNRKYPLLIHYYEVRSHEIYQFKRPEAIRDFINVPYFVSRGYIILIPDIRFKLGAPGENVLNTIMSGVRYLSKNPWIDSTRLGLQGHSFGGWETNYLVTHTHLFAAAAEGAGMSDLVSDYGLLWEGRSRQFYYEMHQGRIRGNLWDHPDWYIEASPIFNASQVTTPLLMMHNKRDNLVPWAQGVEFFTALRRMGKRVWMLQYDDGSHFVDGKNAIDYTIRMMQFFDHYLMGRPAPKWMTEGIPAKKKGKYLAYELDEAGKQP